jgi:hypothetical protein
VVSVRPAPGGPIQVDGRHGTGRPGTRPAAPSTTTPTPVCGSPPKAFAARRVAKKGVSGPWLPSWDLPYRPCPLPRPAPTGGVSPPPMNTAPPMVASCIRWCASIQRTSAGAVPTATEGGCGMLMGRPGFLTVCQSYWQRQWMPWCSLQRGERCGPAGVDVAVCFEGDGALPRLRRRDTCGGVAARA